MSVTTLRRAISNPESPEGLLVAFERLYKEAPGAVEAFARAIAEPSHTQTVSLRFHGGKLQTAVVEITAK